MALGDKTKKPAFAMWNAGRPLAAIQKVVCKSSTTKPASVKGWIVDWERGRQSTWAARIT